MIVGSKVIQTKSHDVVAGEEAGAMCWVCNKCTLETSLHLPPATPMRASAPEPQPKAAVSNVAPRSMSNSPAPTNRAASGTVSGGQPGGGVAAAVSARSASPNRPKPREGAYATINDVVEMDAKAGKPRAASQPTTTAAVQLHQLPVQQQQQQPPQSQPKKIVEAGGAYDIIDSSLLKDATSEYGPAPGAPDVGHAYGPGPTEIDFLNAEEVLKRTRLVAQQQQQQFAQQLVLPALPRTNSQTRQPQQPQQPQPTTTPSPPSTTTTAAAANHPRTGSMIGGAAQHYNAVPSGVQQPRSVIHIYM